MNFRLKSFDQRGAVPIVIALVVVVLAVLVAAGYFVVTNHTEKDNKLSQTVPSTIESKSDLEQASDALDSGNVDSELDPSVLDEDLNELL